MKNYLKMLNKKLINKNICYLIDAYILSFLIISDAISPIK